MSERWAIVIAVLGSEDALVERSDGGVVPYFEICPMKILASVGPSMWRRFLTPGRLYMIDVPPSAHGICSQPLQALN